MTRIDVGVVEGAADRGLDAEGVDKAHDLQGGAVRLADGELPAVDPELDEVGEAADVFVHLGGDFLAERRPVPASLPGVEPEQAELVMVGLHPGGHQALEPRDGIRDGLHLVEHLVPLGRRRVGKGARDELIGAE